MFYWCTIVLVTLVPVATGENSGVKVKLTQRGLDIVAGKAIEKFKQLIHNNVIPDQTLPVLFNPSVTRLQIHINELNSVQKFLPAGVDLAIKSANIQVTGNLGTGVFMISFNVEVDTLAISATVALDVDGAGNLKLNIKKCKTEIGRFRFDPLRLVSALLSGLNSRFPSYLDNYICSMMTTSLADLNPRLATLHDDIRTLSGFDFSMEPAVISSDSIELSLVSLEGWTQRRY